MTSSRRPNLYNITTKEEATRSKGKMTPSLFHMFKSIYQHMRQPDGGITNNSTFISPSHLMHTHIFFCYGRVYLCFREKQPVRKYPRQLRLLSCSCFFFPAAWRYVNDLTYSLIVRHLHTRNLRHMDIEMRPLASCYTMTTPTHDLRGVDITQRKELDERKE